MVEKNANAEYECSACGATVSLEDETCPQCGVDLGEVEDEMEDSTTEELDYVCATCGATISPEDKFCLKCGADVSEVVDEEGPSTEEPDYDCSECGASVSSEATFCPKCGADVSDVAEEDDAPTRASKLIKRYKDAYLVASAVVTFGGIIKGIGVLLAGLIVLATMGAFREFGGLISPVGGFLAAGFVGLLFWLFGVLVSAQGQILKASLDSAVNSSPFLTNEQRAKIMSLH